MSHNDDPHLAVGAYVLHSLPPSEEAAFEDHLAGCATCRHEADELAAVTARLGAAEARTPPVNLRRRVLQAIASARQDRPSTSATPWHRGRRLLKTALAAAVALALALGGVAAWQYSEADTARQEAAEAHAGTAVLAALLAAADTTITTQDLHDGGTASVVASRTHGQAAFVATGLPSLSGDQVYELWWHGESGYRSAGLLSASGGRQMHVLDGRLEDASSVCITVEPAGGSSQPTTDPLGAIRVPA